MLDGAVELAGIGNVSSSVPSSPTPSPDRVEMGGTSAVVEVSMRGIAFATPMAPEASMPIPSAETAETAIQCFAEDIVYCFLVGSEIWGVPNAGARE